ncbi:penicillin-binding protein 2 [Brevibacillus fluminis]|uniref:Penicillin-binding protein 2 n=1 Tax=Brevibacillus fluminis TaxID=511487 RepID=A0A3M8DTG3_9BACL|nr:penicillin-binding protein 2 [Brevibacillus fluminis]RNB90651.1 penicillin-binding protein 2 [Brevibacillus fluminis]
MNKTRQIKQRSTLALFLFTLLWVGLVTRLGWIQVVATHHFSDHDVDLVKSAVKQREQTIKLSSGRGEILDKDGMSLTGKEQRVLAVFPLARKNLLDEKAFTELARLIGQPEQGLRKQLQMAKQPEIVRDEKGESVRLTTGQMAQINQLELPGIVAITVAERYQENEIAKQVIGYIHQSPELVKERYLQEWKANQMTLATQVGASGLEKSFDRFLQGVEPDELSYYVDGQGHLLRGLDLRHHAGHNQFYPLSVKTTLDRAIQEQLEQVADESGLNEGAIVVLDVTNADIVAMVSRPQFDPTKLQASDASWQNHATKQLAPGSVFKTVVAAAALGEGIVSPTDRFLCEGEYGKFGFSCWNKAGHGSITLEEAFAESCNIAFAKIASQVGGDTIAAYAERFGLGAEVGHVTAALFKQEQFRQISGEEAGRVFSPTVSREDEGVLIQTAIGQRDVRMTPLQAANMMVTIANGGHVYQPRLVSHILYRNGGNFFTFESKPSQAKGIDLVTAYKLRRMMRQVVEKGTGKLLQEAKWSVAGKSGTAETEKNGEPRNHQWFVGYAPADEPRYAIAVVAENRQNGSSHLATKLFKSVVDHLAFHDHTVSLGGTAGASLPK